MAKRKAKTRSAKKKAAGPVRVSVSFPSEDYGELKATAAEKRVSIAWVVREAVAAYFDQRTPLFGRKSRSSSS